MRLPAAFHRRHLNPVRIPLCILAAVFRHLGGDVAGCNRVDANIVGRPFAGEGFRQHVYAGLGGVVGGLWLWLVDDDAGHRAEVDDAAAPAGQHRFREGAGTPIDAVQIDINDVLPVFIGAGGRIDAVGDACVVYQDVDAALVRHDAVGRVVYGIRVGDVELHAGGAVAAGHEFLGALLCLVLQNVGDDYGGAGFGESAAGLETDPACTARHHGDPPVQLVFVQIHVRRPCLLSLGVIRFSAQSSPRGDEMQNDGRTIMDRFSLQGRTALVTGASRGIGNGIARGLAEAGADIGIVYRQDGAAAEAFLGELLDMGRDRSFMHQADVTRKANVDGMVGAALNQWGRIDILVNNAGTGRRCPAEEMDEETWDFILDTNLKSVFLASQAVGRHMMTHGGGSIINVGSISALIVNNPQQQCHYNAAKAGVHMLTKCLAVEWVKHGIRVNAIAPGYVETDLTRPFIEQNPEQAEELWKKGTLQERFSAPWEMAGAAVYLASEASTFVTGEVMVVDGGYTLR